MLVFAAVGLSVGLLSFRTWLSPVPLITTLFLKTAIAHGAPRDEAHGAPPAPTWNVVLLFLRVAIVIVLVPVMLRYLGRHP